MLVLQRWEKRRQILWCLPSLGENSPNAWENYPKKVEDFRAFDVIYSLHPWQHWVLVHLKRKRGWLFERLKIKRVEVFLSNNNHLSWNFVSEYYYFYFDLNFLYVNKYNFLSIYLYYLYQISLKQSLASLLRINNKTFVNPQY